MPSERKLPTAESRMKQDYLRLKRDPLPYISAEPMPNNILEWHYVIKGPEDSPYFGGYYHGMLLFPREFPFKPPSIYMLTPNGRFKTNTRLCLSISDFHPDSWNPTWCVGTILTGLLSFMLEKTPTLGSIESKDEEKKFFAKRSLKFNLKNENFCELFPDICKEIHNKLEAEKLLELENMQKMHPNKKYDNGELKLKLASDLMDVDDENDVQKNAHECLFNWQSVYFNIIIIIIFAIFALIVNFFVRNKD